MKKLYTILLALILLNTNAFADIRVGFSPYDDLEEEWLGVINTATKEIKISAFGLTNERIFNALVKKRQEGVKILVCEDKMQSGSKHDLRDRMKKEKIEVVVKKIQVLEHNKMIEVDQKNAIIGSWNLSNNAQNQDNSITVFMDEPEVAKQVSKAIDRIYARDKI